MSDETSYLCRYAGRRPLSVALNGWFWGQDTTGSGQYLKHLVRALLELPTEDLFLLFTPSFVPCPDEIVSQWCGRLQFVRLFTPFDAVHRDLAKVWFEQIAFPAACRRAGADVAHVPYWGPPAASSVPTVATVHDLIPLILPAYRGSLLVRAYTTMVSRTVRGCRLLLTDSRASARDIGDKLGLPSCKVRAIPLAVSDAYRPDVPPHVLASVRCHYDLPTDFLLYLGGFDQRRNLNRLVRAYGMVLRDLPSAPPLVFAGRLPRRETRVFSDLRRQIERSVPSEKIRFIGWISEDDKPAVYSLARAFVFPSLHEGFGLPALEAMACGTPVIASGTTSLGELVADGGLLVDPMVEEDIAAAIRAVITDEGERRRLRASALARAGRYSWYATASQTLQAYLDSVRSSD